MTQTPVGFCECGCGQQTKLHRQSLRSKGHVKGQPLRFVRGHYPPRPGHVVDPVSGCWNYMGHLTPEGRAGGMLRGGRYVSAYVESYERLRGPVADGLVLDHVCRNPRCVNPDHMEPVTQADNARRGRMAKLTLAEVADIRSLRGVLTQVEIGALYGVAPTTISGIMNGRKWREPVPHLRGRA